MAKPANKRVAIFVDNSNYKHTLALLNIRIDIEKMRAYILANFGKIVFAKFYIAQANHYTHQKIGLLKAIRRAGFTIHKVGSSIETRNGAKVTKYDADASIMKDMTRISNGYDTAILFSGDGDFAETTHQLMCRGKKVVVISTDQCTSTKLISACDQYIPLEEILNQTELAY